MAIVIEEELLAPPGFRFTAYEEGDTDMPVGVAQTRGEAVALFLARLAAEQLEEYRFAAATFEENAAWEPLIKAEVEQRRRAAYDCGGLGCGFQPCICNTGTGA